MAKKKTEQVLPLDLQAPTPTPVKDATEIPLPPMTDTADAASRRVPEKPSENSTAASGNLFVDSLDALTADDLGAPKKKKKKDPVNVVLDVVRGVIFWVAVAVFLVSGYQVVSKLYSYKQSEDIYNFDPFEEEVRREDLLALGVRNNPSALLIPVNGNREDGDIGAVSDKEYNEAFERMKRQLTVLRNKNTEIFGYIVIEGDTEIQYPVVQHADNDYYLKYAYDGTYNPAGSIFLDYRNDKNLSKNYNSIICGHNMDNGAPMFSNLLYYMEEDFREDNRYIELYTGEALYTYEVFAAYEAHPSSTSQKNHPWRVNFQNEDDLLGWVDAARAKSLISPNVKVEEDALILTLYTCMNINENRFVVHAVLVDTVR